MDDDADGESEEMEHEFAKATDKAMHVRGQTAISEAAYLEFVVDFYFASRPLQPSLLPSRKTHHSATSPKLASLFSMPSSSELAAGAAGSDALASQKSSCALPPTLRELDPSIGSKCATLLLICRPRSLDRDLPSQSLVCAKSPAHAPRLLPVVAAAISIFCRCEYGVRLSRFKLFQLSRSASSSSSSSRPLTTHSSPWRPCRSHFYLAYLEALGEMHCNLSAAHHPFARLLAMASISTLLRETIFRHSPSHPAILACMKAVELFFSNCCADTRLGLASLSALRSAGEPVHSIHQTSARLLEEFVMRLARDLESSCEEKGGMRAGEEELHRTDHQSVDTDVVCTATRSDYCSAVLIAAVRMISLWWVEAVLSAHCPNSVARIVADTHAPDLETLCDNVSATLNGGGETRLTRGLYLHLQSTTWKNIVHSFVISSNPDDKEQRFALEQSVATRIRNEKSTVSSAFLSISKESVSRLGVCCATAHCKRMKGGQPSSAAASSEALLRWPQLLLSVQHAVDNGLGGALLDGFVLAINNFEEQRRRRCERKRPRDDAEEEGGGSASSSAALLKPLVVVPYMSPSDSIMGEVNLRPPSRHLHPWAQEVVPWSSLEPLSLQEQDLYVRVDSDTKYKMQNASSKEYLPTSNDSVCA
jgi:hypothetical protein